MQFSGVVSGNRLVQQQQWARNVALLKKESRELGFFSSKAAARKAIYGAFAAAVKARADYCTARKLRFGVLFSGGVDSSFIAFLLRKLGYSFTCFSVGIGGSRDLAAARQAAKELKLKLVSKEFTLSEAERIVKEAVKILKTDNPVMIGIAATGLAAVRLAAASEVSYLFTGLGSEEIFAGYQRHAVSDDVDAECWRGLAQMWQRDFLRDFAVVSHFKAAAFTPFLDGVVISAAMRAKPGWKIRGGDKKLILREVAAASGLPRDVAFRPKLAAQYGSGFDKALGRLSKAAGFRAKREYLAFVRRSGKF